MNLYQNLHAWPQSAKEARQIQKRLPRPALSPSPRAKCARFLLGLDCAFPRAISPYAVAAAMLWDCKTKQVVLSCLYRAKPPIPYVSGLLGFREVPLMLGALGKIDHQVDAIMVDGQGIAHPKRLGSAAHLALWLVDPIPVIGVGKTRLVGEIGTLPEHEGASTPLIDKGEVIGEALRSRRGCRPLFVSPGGHTDIDGALAIVRSALCGYRLPEPTRLADQFAGNMA